MKIALINPPSPFLIDEKVFPNMGLVRVGTVLKERGFDAKIIDFAGRKDYIKGIEDITNDFDVYGFSSTTPQFPMVYNMRRALPKNVYTSIGGAHVSALSSLRKGDGDKNIETLKIFDNIFEGEGENFISMFVKGFNNAGIVQNIDDTPIPDRSLIDIESYKFELNGKPTTSIQTQRGCPFSCDFCCGRDVEMYNKVRQHSPDRVLKEMDYLNKEIGYESFMWYDDEINLNQGRLEQLCKRLEDRPYQHRGFVRSDLIVKHPKSAEMMKKAGFVKLCAGVESGSDRILTKIHKGTTSAMNSEARQIIGDAGIHYEAFTLLGFPGETAEDVSMTYNWLRENKPDDFDINIITPFPGSKIYNNAKKSDTFSNYEWEFEGLYFNKPDYSKEDSFYKGKDGKGSSDIRTYDLTNKSLNRMRDTIDGGLRQ